jgi:hypothetical protein
MSDMGFSFRLNQERRENARTRIFMHGHAKTASKDASDALDVLAGVRNNRDEGRW